MIASAIAEFTLQDILSPELLENPYPAFARLRMESPIHEEPDGHGWVLSRYEDVAAALADRRFSSQTMVRAEDKIRGVHPVIAAISRQMLFQDPPHHSRLRGLMVKAFTPMRIEGLRPKILQMTTRLLDDAEREGGCIDFMESIATPLPVAFISHMLGLPEEDNQLLLMWSLAFGELINGCKLTPEQSREAFESVYSLIRYLTKLIAEKRRRPSNDMLSDLIAAEQNGDRLDMEELMMNVILLFGAGHGTTTHLLGNAMLSLLRNPQEFQLLASDPSVGPSAINELLRFEGPVRLAGRIATEDIRMEDKVIRRGDEVNLLIASANHDEENFPDPERLDLRRTGRRPLSFGSGMHSCIGAALARMEAEVVLTEIARRFPQTWLDDSEPRRLRMITFRGLETLPVVLS
jgi:cytochrome P450